MMKGYQVDFDHKINHLSFGDDSNIKNAKRQTKSSNLSPLDGRKASSQQSSHTGHVHNSFTTYYLSVTPARYNINGAEYFVHEFTHSSQTVQTHNYPAVFFRFSLSPVFVNYEFESVSFFMYCIRLCAIMGGVYTIGSLFESVTQGTIKDIKGESDD